MIIFSFINLKKSINIQIQIIILEAYFHRVGQPREKSVTTNYYNAFNKHSNTQPFHSVNRSENSRILIL